jgi:Domain of unknown function (DUF4359)
MYRPPKNLHIMESIAWGNWQKTLAGAGGAMLLLLAGLAATNPAQPAYENYLVGQIENRLQQECSKAGMAVLGDLSNTACRTASNFGNPYLKQSVKPMLSASTERHNLIVASIYTTDLAVPELSFSGRISAIGAFNSFLIYQAP